MKGLPALVCTVFLAVSLHSPVVATSYQIIQLSGLPGATGTTPVAVNSSGQVAINSYLPSTEEAAIWQNGTVTPLPPLPGYTRSWAYDINASGQVVGYSSTSPSVCRACMWQNGTPVDLGWFGDARAINDTGEIVGRGSNYTRAVLWQQGTLTDLGPGEASGINNRGQVVGWDRNSRAMLWDNGTSTVLGPGYARDINDNGQVVGTAGDAYDYDACLWENGTVVKLGKYGHAAAINSSGQVVGYCIGGIWQDGVVTQLPALPGYYPYEELDISDNGQAVGWLFSTSGLGSLSVLWRPVPEPSSLAVLLCGLGACLGLVRRGR